MYEINPFSGNSVSTNNRRYDNICKMGIYNYTIPRKVERELPHPLKEIEETDILSLLLKNGKYKRAFRYMFETRHPIPLKIVPKLLNALRGYRLSFYSLIDLKLSIFVVSNRTRNRIKLQLHNAISRLRFYSNSLIHILSLSNSHNNVASVQKNRGDKSHHVIVALQDSLLILKEVIESSLEPLGFSN